MSKITRVPRGLQQYLGTQNQGENPVDLEQTVKPIVDMSRYYDIENDFWIIGTFSPTAVDNDYDIAIVPDNELWLVKRAAVALGFAGTTAGDSCRPVITLQDAPNQNVNADIPLVSFGTTVFQAAALVRVGQNISQQILVWGGTTIRGQILDVSLTAGSVNGTLQLNYIRLRN